MSTLTARKFGMTPRIRLVCSPSPGSRFALGASGNVVATCAFLSPRLGWFSLLSCSWPLACTAHRQSARAKNPFPNPSKERPASLSISIFISIQFFVISLQPSLGPLGKPRCRSNSRGCSLRRTALTTHQPAEPNVSMVGHPGHYPHRADASAVTRVGGALKVTESRLHS